MNEAAAQRQSNEMFLSPGAAPPCWSLHAPSPQIAPPPVAPPPRRELRQNEPSNERAGGGYGKAWWGESTSPSHHP